jgi:hypothetical protein
MMLLLFSPSPGFATLAMPVVNEADISGQWKFNHFIIDGQIYPAPNPDLDLRFTFFSNHSSTLSWHRQNEDGFCERRAFYLLQGDLLYQKTYWVNPKNQMDCSRDPDMQVDRETTNHFRTSGKQLFIDFDLSDKTLTYVLDLVE